MGHQNIWFSHPRKFGPGSRYCRVCANHHGIIRKYGLNMCRRCFRQYAPDIGFKKADADHGFSIIHIYGTTSASLQ
ncbi:unnamed protein product [Larinioides sclopetarius]|uniref:Small ribosomal subunit protein uS14 n=1 Tax=Larinioides sclopetarius TaxID=280406 RepID=A0AAV1ZJZ0_9ARAC